jgi:lauroyl/myristoyl acyltransferase
MSTATEDSETLVDQATALGYAAAWKLVKRLPEPVTSAGFRQLASAMLRRDGIPVQQLRANLQQVRPADGATLVEAGVQSYLRYWHEAFRLPTWSAERIRDSFTLEGVEFLDAAVRDRTGAVMVPGHLANWDLGGAWAALRYGHAVSVAERLKPKALFDQFLTFRQSLGVEMYGLGDPDLVRTLVRRVQDGRILGLLGDRDIGGTGVPVEFCGSETTLPGGPAMVSMLSGAPMYPVVIWYDGPMLRGQVLDRVPVPSQGSRAEKMRVMTQQMADQLGAGIREHAQDWHMMQRVWPQVGPS